MSRRRREAAKREKRKPFQPVFHTLEKRMMLATFVVMNTNDTGPDSLRQAITDSNGASPGPNEIDFNIGTGAQVISLISALPSISVPVTIDGTTQPGYADTPLIDLDGTIAGTANGLDFEAGSDGSVVSGLTIGNFSEDGILIASAGNTIGGAAAGAGNVISGNASDGIQITGSAAINNVIAGDYIGTDFTGMVAIANGTGVELDSGASGNTIGGLTATPGTGAGNVISGNTTGINDSGGGDDVFEGNLVGMSATGLAVLGNTDDGIDISTAGDTIGGTTTAALNLISGNSNDGVLIVGSGASGNVVEGDYVGTDVTGTTTFDSGGNRLGNSDYGVEIDFGATDNTVGGTSSGSADVISGNVTGVGIGSSGNVVEGNFIGTDKTGTTAFDGSGRRWATRRASTSKARVITR